MDGVSGFGGGWAFSFLKVVGKGRLSKEPTGSFTKKLGGPWRGQHLGPATCFWKLRGQTLDGDDDAAGSDGRKDETTTRMKLM